MDEAEARRRGFEEVDRCGNKAVDEDDRIGALFKNRRGDMVQKPATDVVGVVLRRYWAVMAL